jgi:deoxycytidine triphosphate deaminase
MRTLDAEATAERTEGLIHLDTQRADRGLDLTVDEVQGLTGSGALDFGGSEFEAAPREPVEPKLAHPEDDYGWWELGAGTYLIRYNEALALEEDETALVFPLDRLRQAGASHEAFVVAGRRDPVETLLRVEDAGCRLKENCRVSRLIVTEVC